MWRRHDVRDEGIDEVKDEGGIEKDGRNEVGGREGRHGVGFLCWQLEAGHRAGVGRKTHRIARTQYSFPEVEPQIEGSKGRKEFIHRAVGAANGCWRSPKGAAYMGMGGVAQAEEVQDGCC